MTTDGKVITTTIYCQVCNFNRCNIYNNTIKKGKGMELQRIFWKISLEFRWYKSEADFDKSLKNIYVGKKTGKKSLKKFKCFIKNIVAECKSKQ